LTTFTIEGRAAPGLFVVGWLLSITGLAIVLIGAFGGSGWLFFIVGPAVLTVGLVAAAGGQAIERRAAGEAYSGPSPYLILVAAFTALVAVDSGIQVGIVVVFGRAVPDYVVILASVAGELVIFLGILQLTVVGTGALSWIEMGWRRLTQVEIANAFFGAATAVPVIGLTLVVSELAIRVFQQVPESPLPPTGTPSGAVLQLIAGAILAPIAEEAIFRGFAISAWRRTVGEQGAIVRSSLLFALAHVIDAHGTNFGQVLGLMAIGFLVRVPVGLALGWLFVRTRSIWTPLGLHVTFNGILLLVAEVCKAQACA
jgi:membrane protease YdiL (CAAX protease family)